MQWEGRMDQPEKRARLREWKRQHGMAGADDHRA